jgi:uncharacterized protein
MPAKFVLIRNSKGQFHFNLLATNGRVIASSESYNTRAAAMNGIESIRKNAADARFDDQTAPIAAGTKTAATKTAARKTTPRTTPAKETHAKAAVKKSTARKVPTKKAASASTPQKAVAAVGDAIGSATDRISDLVRDLSRS